MSTPPPYAYDYSHIDQIDHILTVTPEIVIPVMGEPDYENRTYTTQTIKDDTPLEYGKHRGRTPKYIEAIDPGWIVWATKNVDKHRIVWSDELAKRCEAKYASLPKLRR